MLIHILEVAGAALGRPSICKSYHPAPLDRAQRILDMVATKFGEKYTQLARYAIEWGRAYAQAMVSEIQPH
jgi:hypothetical protein